MQKRVILDCKMLLVRSYSFLTKNRLAIGLLHEMTMDTIFTICVIHEVISVAFHSKSILTFERIMLAQTLCDLTSFLVCVMALNSQHVAMFLCS